MIESITVEQVLTPKGWLENQTITADSGKIVSISDATSAELRKRMTWGRSMTLERLSSIRPKRYRIARQDRR